MAFSQQRRFGFIAPDSFDTSWNTSRIQDHYQQRIADGVPLFSDIGLLMPANDEYSSEARVAFCEDGAAVDHTAVENTLCGSEFVDDEKTEEDTLELLPPTNPTKPSKLLAPFAKTTEYIGTGSSTVTRFSRPRIPSRLRICLTPDVDPEILGIGLARHIRYVKPLVPVRVIELKTVEIGVARQVRFLRPSKPASVILLGCKRSGIADGEGVETPFRFVEMRSGWDLKVDVGGSIKRLLRRLKGKVPLRLGRRR